MAAKAVEIGYDILQGKPAPKEPVLIPVTTKITSALTKAGPKKRNKAHNRSADCYA